MSPQSIAQAIQDTDFFTSLRESMLPYPILLATHLTNIAIFGGLILVTDLRLLGVMLKSVPVADIIRGTRPWKRLGFVLQVTIGVLLGSAKLLDYYDNPYFVMKMSLLLLVGVHAWVFHRSVYANPEKLDAQPSMPRVAKVAAICSMVLWIGILSCGRWIAYYEKPDQNPAVAARPDR